MVEMVEILDGRLGKRSVERVRYVINNLLHLVIVKYGDISLLLCISTRLWLVTILSLLVKYLVILHADPCNKSYIYIRDSQLNRPESVSLASLARQLNYCFKVDEPSTNAKKMGYVYVFALNFQYNLRQAIKYCKIRPFNACRLQIGRVGTYR